MMMDVIMQNIKISSSYGNVKYDGFAIINTHAFLLTFNANLTPEAFRMHSTTLPLMPDKKYMN